MVTFLILATALILKPLLHDGNPYVNSKGTPVVW